MPELKSMNCDLTVIGCGVAGAAAALFAANRGLSVVLVGGPGELLFASGFFDLLGVHPVELKRTWDNPWGGIASLRKDLPNHPYAKIEASDIKTAVEEWFSFLRAAGLAYYHRAEKNCMVITPMGTVKPTFGAPKTMQHGIEALEAKSPCLILNIKQLKGFSAVHIAEVLKHSWPLISTQRIDFPGIDPDREVYAERIARHLSVDSHQEKFAETLYPHTRGHPVVGLPSVLGVLDSQRIAALLEKRIGSQVFEIPTMFPSVPGLRIKEALEENLPARGVAALFYTRLLKVKAGTNRGFVLELGQTEAEYTLTTLGVVLATGRFLGGGLKADRTKIRESIFDLPVRQPETRRNWHRRDFLDPRGHPVNSAGLEIDNHFRPIDRLGKPAFPSLFAAGSILAHQDWMRMKCGSGLAVSTAFAAVKAFKDRFM